jgi:hypothetical protein
VTRSWQPLLALALAAAALAVAVVGVTHPSWQTHFIGLDDRDLWGTQWFYWYTGQAVFDGHWPAAHTDLFFHPTGKDILTDTGGNVLDGVLAAPVRALLGPVLGYNVFVLGVLALNGASGVWLARAAGADRWAAGAAGLLLAANPYTLVELAHGRPTQVVLFLAAGTLACWIRIPERGWRAVAGASVLWALTGLMYWYYAVFVGLIAVGWALAHWRDRRALLQFGVAALGAGVLVAPIIVPLLAGGETTGHLDTSTWPLLGWHSVTDEGWPIRIQRLGPFGTTGWTYRADGELQREDAVMVVGLVQVALAAVGVWRAPNALRRWAWGGAMVLGLGLAVGPELEPWLGTPNPIYLGLVRAVSPLQRLWWPVRVVGVLQLLLAVGAGWALSGLDKRLQAAAILGVALLSAGELRGRSEAPLDGVSGEIPTGYHCLTNAEGAIIEVPDRQEARRMYFQTAHGLPVLGGMLDNNPVLVPPEQRALLDLPFASELGSVVVHAPGVQEPQGRDELIDAGFRWVVLDLESASAGVPRQRWPYVQAVAIKRIGVRLGDPVLVAPGVAVFALVPGDTLACPALEAELRGDSGASRVRVTPTPQVDPGGDLRNE